MTILKASAALATLINDLRMSFLKRNIVKKSKIQIIVAISLLFNIFISN